MNRRGFLVYAFMLGLLLAVGVKPKPTSVMDRLRAELSSPKLRSEILRAERLLNALQNLRVVVTIEGRAT